MSETDGLPWVLVLQGPNLNLLGEREPEVYGHDTLDALAQGLDTTAAQVGVRLVHVQSNLEGELVDAVQRAKRDGALGVVVNAGGYTHTSVALRDAFIACELPFVEVHLSNVYAREPFRHVSLLADRAVGTVGGFGSSSYRFALMGLVEHAARSDR